MQRKEYNNIFKNEETHFYYVSYHNIILFEIKKYTTEKTKLKILDAGCGTGGLTKKLSNLGETVGIDINSDAIKLTKRRGIKAKLGSIAKISYPDNFFDVVVSSDVLSHQWVNDDKKVIHELLRVLKSGGILLLKLPAFNFLKSSHDLTVYTKKRYTRSDILKLFEKSKISILKISYLGGFLFPFVLIKILIDKLSGKLVPHSSVGKIWTPLNNLLIIAFNLENSLRSYIDLPFGISIIVVVRKK